MGFYGFPSSVQRVWSKRGYIQGELCQNPFADRVGEKRFSATSWSRRLKWHSHFLNWRRNRLSSGVDIVKYLSSENCRRR